MYSFLLNWKFYLLIDFFFSCILWTLFFSFILLYFLLHYLSPWLDFTNLDLISYNFGIQTRYLR